MLYKIGYDTHQGDHTYFFFFKFSNFVEIGELREDFWTVLGEVFPFWGTIRGE